MGKGTIIDHIANGQYNVTVNYDTSAIDARITILSDRQTLLEGELSTEQAKETPDSIRVKLLKLKIMAVEKQIEYLQNTEKVPTDYATTAWCADITKDLSGEVGLIEIGREKENGINIQPGYDGNATYSETRDGQLIPLMAQTPEATFYNLAMLPGFQKWKPMFRYGTITEIDYIEDTCTVTIDLETSSQQGLNINQSNGFTEVPIEYMDCNAATFTVDDRVIVKFTDYDIASPVVIGFIDTPAECCFLEPWDGPAVTTKFEWLTETLDRYPDSTSFATVVSSGNLNISKLDFDEPSGGWDGDEVPSNEIALSYPDNPRTNGGVMPDVILHSATQMRVLIDSLLFTCAAYPGDRVTSYFSVGCGGYRSGTTSPFFFSIFFMSESPLGNYYSLGWSDIYDLGHWCNSPAHAYQTTFEPGGISGINTDTFFAHYYAYIPITTTDWLTFPFDMDICLVQPYCLLIKDGIYPDSSIRNVIPGISVGIDKIEIC